MVAPDTAPVHSAHACATLASKAHLARVLPHARNRVKSMESARWVSASAYLGGQALPAPSRQILKKRKKRLKKRLPHPVQSARMRAATTVCALLVGAFARQDSEVPNALGLRADLSLTVAGTTAAAMECAFSENAIVTRFTAENGVISACQCHVRVTATVTVSARMDSVFVIQGMKV